jgi:hypothetical protein
MLKALLVSTSLSLVLLLTPLEASASLASAPSDGLANSIAGQASSDGAPVLLAWGEDDDDDDDCDDDDCDDDDDGD